MCKCIIKGKEFIFAMVHWEEFLSTVGNIAKKNEKNSESNLTLRTKNCGEKDFIVPKFDRFLQGINRQI